MWKSSINIREIERDNKVIRNRAIYIVISKSFKQWFSNFTVSKSHLESQFKMLIVTLNLSPKDSESCIGKETLGK